jgi:hypothetical protein
MVGAGAVANFKFVNHTRIKGLLVFLSSPKFARDRPQELANFGLGTLAA